MAGGGGEGEGVNLEYTPTWVVALVCTVIVGLSLLAERVLHYAGKVPSCLYSIIKSNTIKLPLPAAAWLWLLLLIQYSSFPSFY